jgi:hypothetical protein
MADNMALRTDLVNNCVEQIDVSKKNIQIKLPKDDAYDSRSSCTGFGGDTR